MAAFAAIFGAPLAFAGTCTVTSSADSGTGSLREAIGFVNTGAACAGSPPHTIDFSGPFVISLSSELPPVGVADVSIVGGGNVVLDGSGIFNPGVYCGLNNTATTALKISGMEIRNFSYGSGYGVCGKVDARGNKVHGNLKGFYPADGSIIGGPLASERNLIYANSYGIYLNNAGATIQNNHIGDVNGIASVPTPPTPGNFTGVYYTGVGGANITITGNVISGNTTEGVYVSGAGNVSISQNRLGTNAAGTAALPNQWGIEVYFTYGGSIDDNVVSGNSYGGIWLYDTSLSVTRNKIGTDPAGVGIIPNGGIGLDVAFGPGGLVDDNVISGNLGEGLFLESTNIPVTNNRIGTNTAGTAVLPNSRGIVGFDLLGGSISNNVVSGNSYGGINLSSSANVTLFGNKVGTDAGGNSALPNAIAGITTDCLSNSTISSNVVSGNTGYGMYHASLAGTKVDGNSVGVGSGGGALGNTGDGIYVSSDTTPCFALLSGPLEGPKAARLKATSGGNLFDNNVVAHNGGDGILVKAGLGNIISRGSIHSNTAKNISLDFPSVTFDPPPNDSLDADPGPNTRQNHPIVSQVTHNAGQTDVIFAFHSRPNRSFVLEFYANPGPGKPAGTTWLGGFTVTTDGSGSSTVNKAIFPGLHSFVSATATIQPDAVELVSDGTSEFSPISAAALAPAVDISPAAVAFPNTTVGGSSPTLQIQLTSKGTAPYRIYSIAAGASPPACPGSGITLCASGDFSCSNVDCVTHTDYAFNAMCKLSAAFTPNSPGPKSENIWVCDNTSPAARQIPLSGLAEAVAVTVNPATHDFGSVAVGSTASRSFTVTNPKPVAASLGTITVPAPFALTPSPACPSTLPANGSCTFDVSFNPSALGAISATLTVPVNNTGSSPATATLTGTGIAPAGSLVVPTSIDLGTGPLVSATLATTFQVRNGGGSPISISTVGVNGPFRLQSPCQGTTLAPGATCPVSVFFDPLVYGAVSGAVTIDSNDPGGRRNVALQATVSGAAYGFSPGSTNFGLVLVGTRSAPRTFTLFNNGAFDLPLGTPGATGPFAVPSTTCTGSLAPRASCDVDVTFAPAGAADAAGDLTMPIRLPGAPPAGATLLGSGRLEARLALPDSIDFGAAALGVTESLQRTLELRNSGNALLSFTLRVTGPFTLGGNCGAALGPGESCTVQLAFTPGTVGEFRGTLEVVSNAPGGSRAIGLVARVQPRPVPVVRVSPSFVGFGERIFGTQSPAQRVTITNDGSAEALLGSPAVGPDYVVNWQCGARLAPQATCFADISLRPVGFGPRLGTLEFASNAAGSPHRVDLVGTGCRPPTPQRRGGSGGQSLCAP